MAKRRNHTTLEGNKKTRSTVVVAAARSADPPSRHSTYRGGDAHLPLPTMSEPEIMSTMIT